MTTHRTIEDRIADGILLLVLLAAGYAVFRTLAPEPTIVRLRQPAGVRAAEETPSVSGCCRDGCTYPKKCIDCVCTLPAAHDPKARKDLGADVFYILDYGARRLPAEPSPFLTAPPTD